MAGFMRREDLEFDARQNAPARALRAVTPSDANALTHPDFYNCTRGLYVGVSGDVVVVLVDDTAAVTLTGLAAGVFHPLSVKQVKATGTTATGIVAVY